MTFLKNYSLTRWLLLCLSLSFLLTFSCTDKDENPDIQRETASEDDIKEILKLGFDRDDITFNGKYYVVEGDMVFEKGFKATGQSKSNQRINQWLSGSPVSFNNQANITVRITTQASVWTTEINQAINDWNSIQGCRINLTITTNTNASITIDSDHPPFLPLPQNTLAQARFPENGNPGTFILINPEFRNLNNSLASAGQRRFGIVHEIGHTLGFRHTNWQGNEPQVATIPDGIAQGQTVNSVLIPGTPQTDQASVMNGGSIPDWNGFSIFDRMALIIQYPNTIPPSGAVPFHRYVNTNNGDHFYTQWFSELGAGGGGYVYEGSNSYIYNYQAPGTLPLYRYYNGSNGDHFYTLVNQNYSGYTYEMIAGYVFPSAQGNTVPIFRYLGNNGDHFYTPYYQNYGGYNYELVAFHSHLFEF